MKCFFAILPSEVQGRSYFLILKLDVKLPKKKSLSLTQKALLPTIKLYLLPADVVLSMHNSRLEGPVRGDSVSTDLRLI